MIVVVNTTYCISTANYSEIITIRDVQTDNGLWTYSFDQDWLSREQN